MSAIRVLIVDDSVVVRRVLTKIFESTPDIEVVGIAATASIGLQKISQIQPDVVLLDVEMPEISGIEAVGRIRASWPRLPVLMCSSLTERGADVTIRALAAGASDYVPKPSALSADASDFAVDLVAKVRALVGRDHPVVASAPPPVRPASTPRARVEALAIGCSTGGPNALATIFERLPPLPVPVFIVQHMPPVFTRMLAERLSSGSSFVVEEGTNGREVMPGCAYVAPGGFHMTVARVGTSCRVFLNEEPPENSCRPAVDVLFRSVAEVYGAGLLGVVLTGMGHDGTRGSERIVGAGGLVVVQDAASSVVPSMPSSVAAARLADAVIPLDRMASEIQLRITKDRTVRSAFQRSELR